MPEVSSLAWLAAAGAVIPLIWWLHRHSVKQDVFVVPSLMIWKRAAATGAGQQPGQRSRPEWMYRAAAAACLALALAGISVGRGDVVPITVWVDQSPSLSVVEGGVPRWLMAAERLEKALGSRRLGNVRLRALTANDPTVVKLGRDADLARAVRGLINGTRRNSPLPQSKDFTAERQHWLLTDGADSRLLPWRARMPIAQVVEVGGSVGNVGVINLGIRRALASPDSFRGVVTLTNPAGPATERELSVRLNGRVLWQGKVDLPARADVSVPFSFSAKGVALENSSVTAAISEADGFRLDDQLELETLRSLEPRKIRIIGDCGPYVRAALASDPSIAVGPVAGGMTVSCGPQPDSEAALRIWTSALGMREANDPKWTEYAGDLADIRPGKWDIPVLETDMPAGSTPLLVDGADVLVSATPSGALDVRLVLDRGPVTLDAAYPLLLSALVHRAGHFGQENGMARVAQARDGSDISPSDLGAGTPAPVGPEAILTDLTPWFACLAALILLFDLVSTLRWTWPLRTSEGRRT